jgi:hypothetical protein
MLHEILRNDVTRINQNKLVKFAISDLFTSAIVTMCISQSVIVGLESDRVSLGIFRRYLHVVIHISFIIELTINVKCFGFLYLRNVWNVLDIFSTSLALFDLLDIFTVGSTTGTSVVWCSLSIRSLRIFIRVTHFMKSRAQLITLYNLIQILRSSFLPLIYTAVFYSLLALIGAFLVTADILPALTELRSPDSINWLQARAYFGSIFQSYISMVEIVILDDWYSNFCQPLIQSRRWFSGIIVLFVVFVGSLAYANLLLSCMVDSALSVSNRRVEKALEYEIATKDKVRLTLFKRLTEVWTVSKEIWADGSDADSLMSTIKHDKVTLDCLEKLDISDEDMDSIIKTIDPNGVEIVSLADCVIAFPRIHIDAQGQDIVRINAFLSRNDDISGVVIERFIKVRNDVNSTMKYLTMLHSTVTSFTERTVNSAHRIELDRTRAFNREIVRRHINDRFYT